MLVKPPVGALQIRRVGSSVAACSNSTRPVYGYCIEPEGINAMNHPIRAATQVGFFSLAFILSDLNLGWEIDRTISRQGIDIAKNAFQINRADTAKPSTVSWKVL